MLNMLIVGVSGYVGVELVIYVNCYLYMNIIALIVSAQSNDVGKLIFDLYLQLKGIVDLLLQLMLDISEFSLGVDVVFFVIVYEVSYDLVLQFFEVGCVVFDFFGVFCVNDVIFYEKYYGFIH